MPLNFSSVRKTINFINRIMLTFFVKGEAYNLFTKVHRNVSPEKQAGNPLEIFLSLSKFFAMFEIYLQTMHSASSLSLQSHKTNLVGGIEW